MSNNLKKKLIVTGYHLNARLCVSDIAGFSELGDKLIALGVLLRCDRESVASVLNEFDSYIQGIAKGLLNMQIEG